jgi:very-short-patch-repair endonuclease
MTMTWREWREKNFSKMQSPHEKAFATNILEFVSGLSPSDVRCQHPFTGEDGQSLHVDFAIITKDKKIAIEVSGRDKTGTGQAKSSWQHDHDQMRSRALQSQGYEYLPFSNNDFHSQPAKVIRKIEVMLVEDESTSRAATEAVTPPVVAATPGTVPPAKSEPPKRKITALGATLIALGCAVVLALILVVVFANASPQGNLANPGNTKDCSDFATQREAQAWFDKYYDQFGDVAELDGDGDGIVGEGGCTSG